MFIVLLMAFPFSMGSTEKSHHHKNELESLPAFSVLHQLQAAEIYFAREKLGFLLTHAMQNILLSPWKNVCLIPRDYRKIWKGLLSRETTTADACAACAKSIFCFLF